tara:strand:- start:953 stop:2791 length:1839 start_codon:yes stop_codon:yes gene_type:complete
MGTYFPFHIKPSLPILFFFIALSFLVYNETLDGEFLWDDDNHILAVYDINNTEGLKRIWVEPGVLNQYYPLTYSFFWLENKIWNLDPRGYHSINIILHSINGFLLFLVLRKLAFFGGFWVALIFLIHPIQVESVAWITERKNVLSGFFYFSSLLFYLRFSGFGKILGTRLKTKAIVLNYFFSIGCYVLALLSKTVTVTLPAVFLLLHFWKKGFINKKVVYSIIPFFLIGLALCWVPSELEKQHVLLRCGDDCIFEPMERFIIAGGAFWFYLWKLTWPINLTFIYPRWEISGTSPALYLFPASAITLMLILWVGRIRWGRGLLSSVFFYVGTLFPAMGFISYYPIRYSFVANHFQYLAGIGWIVIFVFALKILYQYLRETNFYLGIWIFTFLVYFGIFALTLLAWVQTHAYKNEETLYRQILERNPNSWMPLYNLGIILLERNQPREALKYLTRAVESKPDFSNIHNNIGIALSRLGRKDAAMSSFRKALAFKPDLLQGRSNLAAILVERGLYQEARKNLEIVLRIDPRNINALFIFGNLFLNQKMFLKAVYYYKRVISQKRNNADLYYNLGLAFYGLNKVDKAIFYFKTALLLRPGWHDAIDKIDYLSSEKK